MITVGSYEAQTRLPALLERVTRGQRVTITRHGVPVAMLVPEDSARRRDLPETIRQLKEFRNGRTLKGPHDSQVDRGGTPLLSRFVLDTSVTMADSVGAA